MSGALSVCDCPCFAVNFRLQTRDAGCCATSVLGSGLGAALNACMPQSLARKAKDLWFAGQPMLVRDAAQETASFAQVAEVLIEGYAYQTRAYSGDEPGVGTLSSTESFGQIKLANCGALDGLAALNWLDAEVRIYAGDCASNDVEDLELVFQGVAKPPNWTLDTLSIPFGDRRARFERIARAATFSGRGNVGLAYDGDALVRGLPKPLVVGQVFNVSPVLIDTNRQIYAVSSTSLTAISAVRDRGVALTPHGDFSGLDGVVVPAGSFATDLSAGVFMLGSAPDGQVTADASSGAVTTADAIVELATRQLSENLVLSDISAEAIARLNTAAPWRIGLYLKESQSFAAIMDRLMAGIGGFWFFDRLGMLGFDVPWFQEALDCQLVTDEDLVGGVTRDPGGAVASRRIVNWNRNWTVQSDIPAFARGFEIEGSAISSALATNEIAIDTLLVDADEAADFANTLAAAYGGRRDHFQLQLACGLLDFNLGDCLRLDLSGRFGMQGDQNFKIVAIDESSKSAGVRLRLRG